MPCGQAHRTGSQASRRPTSAALCGARHVVRPAPPRSMTYENKSSSRCRTPRPRGISRRAARPGRALTETSP
eukprot:scaffold143958_cov130-Phaeocystis_antarctica.AAC.1